MLHVLLIGLTNVYGFHKFKVALNTLWRILETLLQTIIESADA